MSNISELANVPQISFIENMTLQETEEQLKAEYARIYREQTGKELVLGEADAKTLLLKAFALIEYQTMQYADIKGQAELLKTSTGEALDALVALLGLTRQASKKATAKERFMLAEARADTVAVPAGTRVKTQGGRYFNTLDYAEIPPGATYVDTIVQAEEAGAESSGILAGEINILVDPIPYIASVSNVDESTGGLDVEDDDSLTERAYLAPSRFSCAGPRDAYEYHVRDWRSDVTDVQITSPEPWVMTFDNCTFNASGKVINVYTDYSAGTHDITVNFNNCKVNSTFSSFALFYKPALNINDSNMGGFKYILNINNSTATAARDSVTCSQVFGFGGKSKSNSGRTDVNLDGKLVFSAGKKLTHSYTDGEHDQAYNYTGDWSAWTRTEGDEHLLYRTRTRTKICKYCSYSETLPEEREEKREYLLHYDLNGGTPAEGADYSDHYYFELIGGNTATVAADPSRAGYQFAGWQDAAGNQYAAGNTVTVDRDITLTAQWNKLVTVSFDLCGHGGANIPSQTFVSGNKASEPTAPKEDGWVFGGWYTEKGCQYRFSFDSAVTSDITLYAKWDRVTTVVSAPVATPTPSPAPAATPTPSPAAAATKTATVKNAAIPQTSDVFPMEGLLALLAVGAVGFGAAGWLRKKHH